MTRLSTLALLTSAGLALAACAPATPPASETKPAESASAETEPANFETSLPAGTYVSDPGHTTMQVAIGHLGLAPYAAYLADVDVQVTLDPENPTNSSVSVTADPTSVFTSYRGDYQATHPNSDYTNWEDAIAGQFLGAGTQDTITFESTSFDYSGGDSGDVSGTLSMNGQSAPVSFSVKLTGQAESHPFTQSPAMGLTAKGIVKRSDFGIAQNMNGFLSDEVTVSFSADFLLDRGDEG